MARILIYFTICLISFANATEAGSKSRYEMRIKITEVAEKCRTSVGATLDDLNDLVNENVAKTKEGKCLHECVMKDLMIVDNAGNFVRSKILDYVRQYFNNDQASVFANMKVFDTCSNRKRTDKECDDAEEYKACANNEKITTERLNLRFGQW